MSQTVTDYATGTPLYRILGGGGGGGDSATAESMTTAERTALTPDAGFLIWDTDLEKLFIGDGSTAGGVEIEGGGGEGTVTGIEASVDGGTATITATGSTTSVKLTGTGGVDVKGNTTTGAVELDAKDLSDGTQSVSKDVKQARFVEYVTYATAATQNALTLLHFSDIHADTAALARIVAAGDALGSLVNDMICTGDLVQYYATGSIASWWNPKVLTVVGNHDSANSSYNWNGISMADRDAYYIAPFESNWSVTHTSGTSYYYKDYATQKVRLIVLDAMLYMSDSVATEAAAQTSWLEGLLASAITGNLHVVIALHAPKLFSPVVPCSFSKYGASVVDTTATMCTISDTIISAVAAAKANGLKFVGYICGHTHQDYINDILGDGSQYAYCVTCAAVTQSQWMAYSDMFRDTTLDAFNLVTIDTSHTTVAIIRGGGANIDEELRPRETISINYGTGEVIDCEIPKVRGGFRAELKNGVAQAARYIDTEAILGSTVTLQAGHAYTATVRDSITLNAETPPTSASYGLDGLLDLTLSGGTVEAGSNVYFVDALRPFQRNICAVRYIDGLALVSVITVISAPFEGYVVTVASGTTDGSLYYGLATSTETNVGFNVSLNGQTVSLGNAVTNGEKNIIGNGFADTIISGGISCMDATMVTNLSLSGVSILGGTMTIQDGNIPAGASVTVVGYADLRLVSGAGVFDMTGHAAENSAGACFTSGGSAYITGATFANATGVRAYRAYNTSATLNNCTFTNNTSHANDVAYSQSSGSALISGCTFSGNIALPTASAFAGAGAHIADGGVATVDSCIFDKNNAGIGVGGGLAINVNGTADTIISGCTFTSNCVTSQIAKGGGGLAFYRQGTVHVSSCTISGCTAGYGGGAHLVSGVTAYFDDCAFVGNSAAGGAGVAGGAVYISSGCTAYFNNTNFTNNYTPNTMSTAGAMRVDGAIVYLTGCNFSGNGKNNGTVYVGPITGSKGLATISGCSFASGQAINKGSGGNIFLAGSNTIAAITGAGKVTISSGATVTLITSITSNIIVEDGGCTVNGVSLGSAGGSTTYTSIVSSGGSAVAS